LRHRSHRRNHKHSNAGSNLHHRLFLRPRWIARQPSNRTAARETTGQSHRTPPRGARSARRERLVAAAALSQLAPRLERRRAHPHPPTCRRRSGRGSAVVRPASPASSAPLREAGRTTCASLPGGGGVRHEHRSPRRWRVPAGDSSAAHEQNSVRVRLEVWERGRPMRAAERTRSRGRSVRVPREGCGIPIGRRVSPSVRSFRAWWPQPA
jgi:hypothetical protein